MWSVAQTRSGFMRVAEVNLARQQFRYLAPRVMDEEGRLTALFQRYLFVEVGEDEPADWRAVNGTRGIEKLLPLHLEEPGSLPPGYVEELIERVSKMQTIEAAIEASRNYVKGDLVEITCGPLAGMRGTFEQKRRGMAQILMNLLGQQSAVYVPMQNTARTPLR